uniref:Uncharacterized protein n=1 Tax=Arion vulgaris TaxID=1028688 RepID=A0A0B7BJG7_9EUPU
MIAKVYLKVAENRKSKIAYTKKYRRDHDADQESDGKITLKKPKRSRLRKLKNKESQMFMTQGWCSLHVDG